MFGFSLFRRNKTRGLLLRPALTLCLAVLLLVPAAADDLPYYQVPIERLASWNVMSGDPDGGFYPERSITRAEFVAMVNRAYGYTEVGPTPFKDVPENAWYADDIAIAYNAGYFSGTSPSAASPGASLTREQAMVLLAKNMRLEAIPGEVTQFTDGRDFSSYSKGYVKAAVQHGLIAGFPDGSFQPQASITRGQMATILSSALGTLVPDPGEHSLGSVFGNVTLNQSNTTLRDTIINGDLYISGGLGLGAVTLDNVQVRGKIVVAGGGVSETGEDSVVLVNTEADNLLVDSLTGQYLSLRSEGDTLIPESNIRSDAFVQDRSRSGYGLLSLTLDGTKPNAQYTLSGNLGKIFNKSPSSSLTLSKGTLDSLTVDEAAAGSRLIINNDATVKELNLDTGVPVTGSGDIDKLNVNAAGATTAMLPDKIAIRPGLTAGISGETMDTKLGEESSADPRLLAGYPKAKDVAPTSLTAAFSGNKSGTVYWAVSAISDGSVDEAALISPASYGSKAVKNGNLKLTASNTETTAKVTGLSSGGSYYLSAVMVDNRGTHSPVKVVSFECPDSSVPNFAKGYPVISRMRTSADHSASAQVKVMATKSCDLYYAVLPADAAAPTADDFKTSNISGNKGFGIHRMTKNVEQYITVSDTLVEQENYAVYLWLTDSDGAKSSAVKKLTFTTPDGTPPEFLVHPTCIAEKDKELQFTCTVSELCDIYWVAVRSGSAYPTPPANGTLTEAYVQDSIMKHNGTPVKYGSVKNVKPNASTTIKISQLTPATAYDVYYVAADKAKPFANYSAVNLAAPTGSYRVTASTTDNINPTVTLKASYLPGNLLNVQLIFSEGVRMAAPDNSSTLSFQTLYNNVTSAKSEADRTLARNILSNTLDEVLTLTVDTRNGTPVKVRDSSNDKNFPENEFYIDYRNAKVSTAEDGKLTVQFTMTASKDTSALKLNEGTRYWFKVENVVDLNGYLSDNSGKTPNPLVPDPTYLEFTTAATTARYFQPGSPLITAHDNFIDFSYQLNNEGTVHYLAVPTSAVNSTPPTKTSADNAELKSTQIITPGTRITAAHYATIPPQGLTELQFNHVEDDNTLTYKDHVYYPLDAPGVDYILDAADQALETGCVAGSLKKFTGQVIRTDQIEGLQDSRDYILYLVIENGGVYSTPQAFRFTTTNPEKPVLEASKFITNDGVDVDNRMRYPNKGTSTIVDNSHDADLQFRLIRDDSHYPIKVLDEPLPKTWTDKTTGKAVVYTDPNNNGTLTLREALTTPHYKATDEFDSVYDGSLFDNYVSSAPASESAYFTDLLKDLLNGRGVTTDARDSETVDSPAEGGSFSFDFTDDRTYPTVQSDQRYFFLCAGTNGGTGMAYVGVENVIVSKSDPPVVDRVTLSLVNTSDQGVTGIVTLHFNEQLYNVQALTMGGEPLRQPLYATEQGTDANKNYVGLGQLEKLQDQNWFTPRYEPQPTLNQQFQFEFHGPKDRTDPLPVGSTASLTISPYVNVDAGYDNGYFASSGGSNTSALYVDLTVDKVFPDTENAPDSYYWEVAATVSPGWGGKSATARSTTFGTKPTEITLTPEELTLTEGETDRLYWSVEPAQADQTVTWKTSARNVATVSSDGTVTAVGVGTATITATTVNGLSKSCNVTVNPRPATVQIATPTLSLAVGETRKPTFDTTPNGATLEWSSSDDNIATVDKLGNVKGINAGTATITAKAEGNEATCTVTVKAATP